MVLPRLVITLLAATLLAAVGCRCSTCGCVPAPPVAPCAFSKTLPDPARPDIASLVPECLGDACEQPCLLSGPTECYESLERSTCQCQAATNTTVANAVEVERYWAGVLIGCEEGPVEEALCLTRGLLAIQAADLRNSSAASALTTFYLLAGLEAEEDLLDLGIQETEASIRRLDGLRAENLPLPEAIDRGELASRLADLQDQRLQLCFARIQLNGQLKRLLGCPLDERRFFWPEVDWTPNLAPMDIEGVVAEGLAYRSDIRSLRLVRCKLNSATVPVARQVLQVADGTLGTVAPAPGLVHHLRCGDCKEHEVAVRCRQLSMLEADATQLAIAKIKSAAYKVAVQQDRVRLSKRAVEDRRIELAELQKLRDAEDTSVFEISAAMGRVWSAESSLLKKVVELKVAEVGLREAQGMLAVECGYEAYVCCEHCCTGECGCRPCGCCGVPGCGSCIGQAEPIETGIQNTRSRGEDLQPFAETELQTPDSLLPVSHRLP